MKKLLKFLFDALAAQGVSHQASLDAFAEEHGMHPQVLRNLVGELHEAGIEVAHVVTVARQVLAPKPAEPAPEPKP